MTDLNEYLAEAIETAYAVDYEPELAQKVIEALEAHRWAIVDVSDAEALPELPDAPDAPELMPLLQLGPRFVQLTRQVVNADHVALVVADSDSECTLWLSGGATVVEPSPAAEVVALLEGADQ